MAQDSDLSSEVDQDKSQLQTALEGNKNLQI